VIAGDRPDVFDLHRRSLHEGAPNKTIRPYRKREDGPKNLEFLFGQPAVRVERDLLTVEEVEAAERGVA
jgi:hypothetical protein